MDDAVQAEYDRLLARVVLKQGELVRKDESQYGWHDYNDGWVRDSHHRTCEVTCKRVQEVTWYEFQGTFYEGDESVHGVSAFGVTCACGKLKDREVRWSAAMQEVAQAVFEELYKEIKR